MQLLKGEYNFSYVYPDFVLVEMLSLVEMGEQLTTSHIVCGRRVQLFKKKNIVQIFTIIIEN